MITLITGGSGSGKSAYAEGQVLEAGEGRRVYIATMHPYDEESYRRIERHRNMRKDKQFETVERYVNLKDLIILKGSNVLLECMSNLVANEMFQEDGAGADTVEAVVSGVKSLEKQAAHLFIVTNEIHSDGIEYDSETQRYQRYLGEINRQLGEIASRVVEVVYGIPIELKNAENTEKIIPHLNLSNKKQEGIKNS